MDWIEVIFWVFILVCSFALFFLIYAEFSQKPPFPVRKQTFYPAPPELTSLMRDKSWESLLKNKLRKIEYESAFLGFPISGGLISLRECTPTYESWKDWESPQRIEITDGEQTMKFNYGTIMNQLRTETEDFIKNGLGNNYRCVQGLTLKGNSGRDPSYCELLSHDPEIKWKFKNEYGGTISDKLYYDPIERKWKPKEVKIVEYDPKTTYVRTNVAGETYYMPVYNK
jgi:hypothetical protein